MIVKFLTFYAPTCSEILELHLRLLDPVVDHFVITESNVTHAGNVAPQALDQLLEQWQWPRDRVTVIHLNIPPSEQLKVEPIDIMNTYECFTHHNTNVKDVENQRARTRERLQKDSLLTVLDRFPDDTVYIHSDCDEILAPNHVRYLAKVCREKPSIVVKVPLVNLQGRADLRVYNRVTGRPVPWEGGMFLAMRQHFQRTTPICIRSNNDNPYRIEYITENGVICQDLGWHFSWMGTNQQRLDKTQNFAHYRDRLSFLASGSYDDPAHLQAIQHCVPGPGDIPPSGDVGHVLAKYDTSLLPQMIWDLPAVKQYLLP